MLRLTANMAIQLRAAHTAAPTPRPKSTPLCLSPNTARTRKVAAAMNSPRLQLPMVSRAAFCFLASSRACSLFRIADSS